MSVTDLPTVLKNQFHAAMAMMRMAIERCPLEVWTAGIPCEPSSDDHHGGGSAAGTKGSTNQTWRVIYHTLYSTHLYLLPAVSDFQPWEHHQTGLQDLDDHPAPPEIQDLIELPHRPPQSGDPYTKEQMLEYWHIVDSMIDDVIDSLDLSSPESGCPWYNVSTIEFKLVALRHLQHHTAQIGARIRHATHGRNGVDWVGSGSKATRAEFPQAETVTL